MCLVAISWQNHPEFPLIISANRDEFFERPTAAMHLWESGFYGGKDLRSGGTWLGFHPNGRWSLLTNYRDFTQSRKAEISRGKLVQDFVEGQSNPEEYLRKIQSEMDRYDGFNLLVSDGNKLFYLSNFGEKIEEIHPGIHGLSNGLINDPWPKIELAKTQLAQILQADISEGKLLEILKSTEKHPLESLPKTGVSSEMEIGLSSQLIRLGENYGTVSSTAVLQHKSGLTHLKERTFQWDFTKFEDLDFTFQINQPV
ncbi:MAG: NRDE family protein [Algoriphagus sp.]|nr:NRDE family protein [Algoriphagus sp.]